MFSACVLCKKTVLGFDFVFMQLNWLLKTKDRFNVHPETLYVPAVGRRWQEKQKRAD